MSQVAIMNFLDENPGKYYSIKELHNIFKKTTNYNNICRNMKKVLRREEYIAIIRIRLTKEAGVKYVRCYGVKKDGNK